MKSWEIMELFETIYPARYLLVGRQRRGMKINWHRWKNDRSKDIVDNFEAELIIDTQEKILLKNRYGLLSDNYENYLDTLESYSKQ